MGRPLLLCNCFLDVTESAHPRVPGPVRALGVKVKADETQYSAVTT